MKLIFSYTISFEITPYISLGTGILIAPVGEAIQCVQDLRRTKLRALSR